MFQATGASAQCAEITGENATGMRTETKCCAGHGLAAAKGPQTLRLLRPKHTLLLLAPIEYNTHFSIPEFAQSDS